MPDFVVRLQGGIGNQIFQFAFCRYIESVSGRVGSVDSRALSKYQPPRLPALSLIFDSAAFRESNARVVFGRLRAELISSLTNPSLLALCGGKEIAVEGVGECDFDRAKYFSGYWQDFKYVGPVLDELTGLLLEPPPATTKFLASVRAGDSRNLVALHVRRGDYASNPLTLAHHGVLGDDYFQNALRALTHERGDVSVLVFSDDISWVKQHVAIPASRVEYVQSLTDVEEFFLMRECDHHIISNSTFSWWGAVLRRRAGGTRFAPKSWFVSKPSPPIFDDGWRML